MQSVRHYRILAAPGCRYPKEFYVTAARARLMVKAGKIVASSADGRTFRTVPPGQQPPRRDPLTRISRGGPLAAAGMSQIMTTRDERAQVDGLKTIYADDAHLFRLSAELYGTPTEAPARKGAAISTPMVTSATAAA